MGKTEALKFLKRYLLITVGSIVLVGLTIILGAENNITAILSIVILLAIVFLLLYYLIVSVTNLFKNVFSKKEKFDWLYLLGFFFALCVFILFMYFYLSIIGASVFQLL